MRNTKGEKAQTAMDQAWSLIPLDQLANGCLLLE